MVAFYCIFLVLILQTLLSSTYGQTFITQQVYTDSKCSTSLFYAQSYALPSPSTCLLFQPAGAYALVTIDSTKCTSITLTLYSDNKCGTAVGGTAGTVVIPIQSLLSIVSAPTSTCSATNGVYTGSGTTTLGYGTVTCSSLPVDVTKTYPNIMAALYFQTFVSAAKSCSNDAASGTPLGSLFVYTGCTKLSTTTSVNVVTSATTGVATMTVYPTVGDCSTGATPTASSLQLGVCSQLTGSTTTTYLAVPQVSAAPVFSPSFKPTASAGVRNGMSLTMSSTLVIAVLTAIAFM